MPILASRTHTACPALAESCALGHSLFPYPYVLLPCPLRSFSPRSAPGWGDVLGPPTGRFSDLRRDVSVSFADIRFGLSVRPTEAFYQNSLGGGPADIAIGAFAFERIPFCSMRSEPPVLTAASCFDSAINQPELCAHRIRRRRRDLLHLPDALYGLRLRHAAPQPQAVALLRLQDGAERRGQAGHAVRVRTRTDTQRIRIGHARGQMRIAISADAEGPTLSADPARLCPPSIALPFACFRVCAFPSTGARRAPLACVVCAGRATPL